MILTLMRSLFIALMLALLPAALAGPSFIVGSATAQQASAAVDYTRWAQTANRASNAIEAARASTAAFEELRTQLVDWRDQFFAAQNANANAIATTQAQLKALGAAPEAGEEDPEIVLQRTDLADRLNRLTAPGRQAQLAYSEADGMIKGIDGIIRERQTEELLELGPSPLNPQNWQAGLTALSETFDTVRGEVSRVMINDVQYAELRNDLPKVLILAVLGFILLIRGRFWVEMIIRLTLQLYHPSKWSRISSAATDAGEVCTTAE